MVRQLFSLAVALLIANPVCCCTVGMFRDGSRADSSGYSCCSGSKPAPAPETPDDGPGCPCDKDPTILAEVKIPQPDCPCGVDGKVPLLAAFQEPPAGAAIVSPCPPNLDLPPPPRAFRLFCRYLL